MICVILVIIGKYNLSEVMLRKLHMRCKQPAACKAKGSRCDSFLDITFRENELEDVVLCRLKY